MKLEQNLIYVKDVVGGDEGKVEDGLLTVDVEGLRSLLLGEEKVSDVRIAFAKPGEDARITAVRDVVEPRMRIGRTNGFPGVTTKYEEAGNGVVNILKGAAIVTVDDTDDSEGFVIEMQDDGADQSLFSKTLNIVVGITLIDGLEPDQREELIRVAGCRAATFVGLVTKEAAVDSTKVYEIGTMAEEAANYPGLPKVALVEITMSQEAIRDTTMYGVEQKQCIPTWFHPNEELDQAVVCGRCVAAGDKTTTYERQNNEVVLNLIEQHGKRVNYVGNVFLPEMATEDAMLRNCEYAVRVCKQLGVAGVVVTLEGQGNTEAFRDEFCSQLQASGIKTAFTVDDCIA